MISRILTSVSQNEIEKATKHLNDEMDEAAEEFYKAKKDDGLEREVIVL